MIFGLHGPMKDTCKSKQFDAIIIGSGPGGATVAKELSLKKKKILILERGHNQPIKGSVLQTMAMGLVPGKSLLFNQHLMGVVRTITTGGSSVMAYASALDPPRKMLSKYGIEIENEYEETLRELPVSPLSDHLVGPISKRIMESARSLGYDWQKLPKIVYQDKCIPECDMCTVGCPLGAKWNARMFVDEAVKNGAELITGARIKKLIINNGSVDRIVIGFQGEEFKISSEKIILAAGGIGSPVILRASGLMNAGYDYFVDPIVVVMGIGKRLGHGREFPMTAGMRMEKEGYLLTDLVWPKWVYKLFVAQIFRFDCLFSQQSTLPIMIKIRDRLGGYLTDGGGVRKTLSMEDKAKFKAGYDHAERILKHAGVKKIFRTWYLASHPGGTVKINEILDSNLKTEIDNLYVCDCSVVPEEMGLPPMLTLICLAKRLAKQLC